MKLAQLLESYDRCHQKLLSCIRSDADYSTISLLDRHLQHLADTIKNLRVSSTSEIKAQIRFFLSRAAAGDEIVSSSSDLNIVDTLLERYVTDLRSLPNMLDGTSVLPYAKIQFGEHVYSTDSLSKLSETRISLYNTDYAYEFTSLGNARFHRAQPSDFVGKHVSEIIGDQRYEQRARKYFDRCFSGESLGYCYFLDIEDLGERLMDCRMTPYRDGDGVVRGAYFYVEDISEKIEASKQSALKNSIEPIPVPPPPTAGTFN